MSIATEISRLQTAKADIRQALIDKGVDVPSTDTLDEYPQYIQNMSSGDVTNGVIEEYLASTGTVAANTFVEFVTEVGVQENMTGSNVTLSPRIVSLGDDRAFLVYRKGSSGYRYGRLVSIANGTVVLGEEKLISTTTASSYAETVAGVSPDGTRAVVVWRASTNSCGAVVCSFSDDSFAIGQQLDLSTSNSYPTGAEWLDNDRVFFARAGGSSPYAYGEVLAIGNDGTITSGTSVQLQSVYGAPAIAVMSPSKVACGLMRTSSSSSTASTLVFGVLVSPTGTITVGATASTDNYYGINVPDSGVVRTGKDTVALVLIGRPQGQQAGVNLVSEGFTINDSGVTAKAIASRVFGYGVMPGMTGNIVGAHIYNGKNGILATLCISADLYRLGLKPAAQGVVVKDYAKLLTLSGSFIPEGCFGEKYGVALAANGLDAYIYPLESKIKESDRFVEGVTKTDCTVTETGDVWILAS